MIKTSYKKQELNSMQQAIIKAIANSPIMFAGTNYILLDYSSAGSDATLICKLRLMEKLITRHFKVAYTHGLLGQIDYVLYQDIA